jgi:hypothetical protein
MLNSYALLLCLENIGEQEMSYYNITQRQKALSKRQKAESKWRLEEKDSITVSCSTPPTVHKKMGGEEARSGLVYF